MTEAQTVMIRFKDVDHDDELRSRLEDRCRALAQEFPETMRFELSLSPASPDVDAHVHVAGKETDFAAHATAADARLAGDRALDKLERELRRKHDKKIFARRREAQRASGKRT